MGLLKAIRNFAMRKGNNYLYHQAKQKAHESSFSETGEAIRKAKKKGYFFNASNFYHRKYKAKIEKANEDKELREKFISDW